MFETTTTIATGGVTNGTIPQPTLDSPVEALDTTTSIASPPVETLPEVAAEVNSKGIFPDPGATCP